MKKILVIDGNSILNRAFYGVRPLTTKDGRQTGAIFGMLNIIFSQIDRVAPDGVVVAFDLKDKTFRHNMYDGYKANRHGMPEELASQLQPSKDILSALGFKVVSKSGYEADDILGTVANMCKSEGDEVYILSGDRDLFQLIDDHVFVLHAGTKETALFDKAVFEEKYGIPLSLFVDLKALMGDSSDNIPGVAGIGEKTAVKIISEYGGIDDIYSSFDSLKLSAGVKNKLLVGKDNAYLSKTLAKIVTDAPIELTREDIFEDTLDKKRARQLLLDIEFGSFIKKLSLDAEEEAEGKEENKNAEYISVAADELVSMGKTDKLIYGHFNSDRAFLFDGDEGYVCQYDDISMISGFFTPDRRLAVYDSKKLYHLAGQTLAPEFSVELDIMLASYLLDPTQSEYTFEKTALSYLAKTVSENDAEALCRLGGLLCEKLKDEELWELYSELELPLSKVLYRMEKRGFSVDCRRLSEYSEYLLEKCNEYSEEIYALAGKRFNINSPKQLGEILFDPDNLGLPAAKKTKSGYSTGAEILEKLQPYHPIISLILEYRKLSKLRSTYTEGLCRLADENGIIHTEFKQTGTMTGRLSSIEPNLQNIPVRSPEGRELRKFFVARGEDRVLIDADYSQIELRVLAHLSGDESMVEAFNSGEDIHTMTAASVFRVHPAFVTPEMRKRAKAVNFGIIYGMSDFSLAQDIGITKKQAARYIEDYFAKYPKIKEYLDGAVQFATDHGYSVTISGRKRAIPELSAGKAQLRAFGTRVAMNSPIQGSAADIIKIAMINTEKALTESGLDACLILQVHDELIVESSRADAEKAAEILCREMENAIKLKVALEVEWDMGDSWFDCK